MDPAASRYFPPLALPHACCPHGLGGRPATYGFALMPEIGRCIPYFSLPGTFEIQATNTGDSESIRSNMGPQPAILVSDHAESNPQTALEGADRLEAHRSSEGVIRRIV